MWLLRVSAAAALSLAAVSAQTPVPTERVTFDDAIRRAVEKNPSDAAYVMFGPWEVKSMKVGDDR